MATPFATTIAAAASALTSISATEVRHAAGQEEATGLGHRQAGAVAKGRNAAGDGLGLRAEQLWLGDDDGGEVRTGEGEGQAGAVAEGRDAAADGVVLRAEHPRLGDDDGSEVRT
uniref:Uncharacterized protein n=1 Tax=Oryza rufipogon TaxID=4529 RepID=A0A0E0QMH7_ORYRU